MSIPFFIIDVFTTTPYKGNPLAVVPTFDSPLSTTQMKLLARQFNLSETTFICPPATAPATYRLRSFLPNGGESGSENVVDGKQSVYHQELGGVVFPVEITVSQEKICISMHTPQFLSRHPDPATLSGALGLELSEIGFHIPGTDTSVSEARVVTTSPARHLLVPVRDVQVLLRVRFSSEAVATELEKTESWNSGVYVFAPGPGFSPESVDQELSGGMKVRPRFEARFFSPGMGAEDPATGSAAGPLGAYLWENRVVDRGRLDWGRVEVEIVQGREKRGSVLWRFGWRWKGAVRWRW
ncbi:PhzF family phenazine biosynthesis protein [Aspergillus affinis]|uniref:PhzF family phenazine biosynthesis protein n=1 Tax=Aspergillus affinis TaxID=1070780 RepID=UPI0022FE2D36|nr:Diaminopimelate epimerase-like protein [Aspergillus affinis]KAI9043443.1 Diaminopimelate epimerase-like protein [Aspergillus affinis]